VCNFEQAALVRSEYFGLNFVQQTAPDLGVFARAGIAQRTVEEIDFTDINQSRQVSRSPACALEVAEGDKLVQEPDWSRLALWDELRARWTGSTGPDPLDRCGVRFTH
jgi:hypothetical protein